MGKKKRLAMILAGLAVFAAAGGTYALFTASVTTTHTISTRDLGIAIRQVPDEDKAVMREGETKDEVRGFSYQGMPGDTVREQIWVENTKAEDCYVRVQVQRYWEDEEGNPVSERENQKILPEEIQIQSADGWLIYPDRKNPEILHCYYQQCLPAGKMTTEVMESFTLLGENLFADSNAYAGLRARLVFTADAVQAFAAQEAMASAWGVRGEFENKTLVQVTGQ